ncbi:hypothetical protein GLOTRDRAFT_131486 [Gloeophyllum trabeum ATCC 11539]|uniref:Nudix hydrolase domain-containing protein n=1 Tax=Gloeophyllum trabeum (strain ATCC 11539 / FP-39264 / Madison 617) TaxID=670483 RepID=S7RKL2_GLOTA|nr:uncharacterized protein GLOTRDRAFT_131486 [Gloeophyllum trabeum ATCC 11539]EPQ53209.1 hypothetical protein GLOTRDRAFT_131486 [Gloeophyllum trabeum ATCC 11539]
MSALLVDGSVRVSPDIIERRLISPPTFLLPPTEREDIPAKVLIVTRSATGLKMSKMMHMGDFKHFVYAVPAGGDGDATERVTIQLNFAVSVKEGPVVLCQEEHQDYAWVAFDDLAKYELTAGMDMVVKDALQWAEAHAPRQVPVSH